MNDKETIDFEKALTRLQEISELLEQKEVSLDESIKLYEEGIELAKQCYDVLNDAELKISTLQEELEKHLNSKAKTNNDEEL